MKQSQWNDAMNLLDADLVESFVKKQEKMVERKKSKVLWLRRSAVAACFMLVFAAFAGYFALNGDQGKVAATIMLDVNPSLKIRVDENEKVLEVVPLNEDAKTVVGDRDFKNKDLTETVRVLVDSIIENGFINEAEKAVLIGVDSKNSAEAKAIREKLTEQIMSQIGEDGIVIGQDIQKTEDVYPSIARISEEYGISLGKASIVYEIVSLYSEFTEEQLVKLSISDLSILLKNNGKFDITGTTKAVISHETAVKTALETFQLKESDQINDVVTFFGVDCNELIYDVNLKVYDGKVEREYKFSMDPITGETLRAKVTESNISGSHPYYNATLDYSHSIFEAYRAVYDEFDINPDDGYMLIARRHRGRWHVTIKNVDNKDYRAYIDISTGKITEIMILDRDDPLNKAIYKEYIE
ncbi:MAG: hypothetical protein E7616_04820 [Ruminococcaceae bacterium]|nr:hypothetical protein [Oscillospiraceae bacterium]